MALKDWKLIHNDLVNNLMRFIRKNPFNELSVSKEVIYSKPRKALIGGLYQGESIDISSGKNWEVLYGLSNRLRVFRTKASALKFAKEYMRKN